MDVALTYTYLSNLMTLLQNFTSFVFAEFIWFHMLCYKIISIYSKSCFKENPRQLIIQFSTETKS